MTATVQTLEAMERPPVSMGSRLEGELLEVSMGPQHPSTHGVFRMNVALEGEIAYRDLPRRMSNFDVAVIPFLRMPLTMATNPLKLYEYFCLGIPVVSTRLPEIEPFGDLVYLADTPGEFLRGVEQAVADNDPARRARRKAVAEGNTWRARCEEISRRFESL